MANLVRIGRIDTNKSGVGSRGYVILRRGKTVVLRWGQVDSIGGTIYWGGSGRTGDYWEKKVRKSSEVAAKKFARWKKKILCTPGTVVGGYHPLPSRSKIYARRPE